MDTIVAETPTVNGDERRKKKIMVNSSVNDDPTKIPTRWHCQRCMETSTVNVDVGGSLAWHPCRWWEVVQASINEEERERLHGGLKRKDGVPAVVNGAQRW